MRLLGENKKKTLIRFGETSKYAYEWISICFVEHWTLFRPVIFAVGELSSIFTDTVGAKAHKSHL